MMKTGENGQGKTRHKRMNSSHSLLHSRCILRQRLFRNNDRREQGDESFYPSQVYSQYSTSGQSGGCMNKLWFLQKEAIVCPWQDLSGISFGGQSEDFFSPKETKWHDFKAYPGTQSLTTVSTEHKLTDAKNLRGLRSGSREVSKFNSTNILLN